MSRQYEETRQIIWDSPTCDQPSEEREEQEELWRERNLACALDDAELEREYQEHQ
jgi:hypothetical protein